MLSQVQYAKHRGVSQPYINRLVKQGKIPTVNGKIDPAAADAALDAVADPSKDAVRAVHAARRAAQRGGAVRSAVRPTPDAADDDLSGSEGESYNEAKLRDARAAADLREMEAARERGNQIDRGAYAKGCEDVALALGKELDALQHRLAPLVAGESSIQRCRELIAVEVNRARDTLADTLEALAAPPKAGTRQ